MISFSSYSARSGQEPLRALLILVTLLCSVPVSAQEVMPELMPFAWREVGMAVPPSVRIFAGESFRYDGLPVRVWRVEVDYSDTGLAAQALLSRAPSGKETVGSFARQAQAVVAINGGYFDMLSRPARTYSLVKSGGQILSQNIGRVSRSNGSHPVLRAAFGVRPDRTFAFDWIAHRGTEILKVLGPLDNAPSRAAAPPDLADAQTWNDLPEAIGGGPMLLKDGQGRITYNEEAFFGSGFEANRPYPRTAIGATPDQRLIFFITDGKQPEWSVGLTLPQLAEQLREVGCTEAMNLDGGGSTTLVVNGQLLNVPSDGAERAVTSVLAIVPAPK